MLPLGVLLSVLATVSPSFAIGPSHGAGYHSPGTSRSPLLSLGAATLLDVTPVDFFSNQTRTLHQRHDLDSSSAHRRVARAAGGAERRELEVGGANLKAVANPKLSTSPRTTTSRASTSTISKRNSASATSTAVIASGKHTCAKTSDCHIALPPGSHQRCYKGVCTFGCNKNMILNAAKTGCVAAPKTTSKPAPIAAKATTATKKTTTTTTRLTLPTPPSSSCASPYTDTSSGAVFGPGLGTFPMAPRPSTFVRRNGRKLMLDGREYRMVGPNIYWLGLDENVIPSPSYPTKGRIREAMAMAVAMGGNTVRSHTLGISTGNPLSLWPKAYQTNDAAFDAIDYSIWAARNYGLRLVIPLTDNYAYYHGGKYDFIGWAGLSKSDGSQFYTSQAVIKIFKAYISVLLNHVNAYTGVAYKDDPTILAWETANELGGWMLSGDVPSAAWSEDIATYIKSIATRHLVFDGSDGLTNQDGDLENHGFGASRIDAVTDHFYPALDWLLQKDKGIVAAQTAKVYFVGELDWTGQRGGDSLETFYSILEGIPGSGSMIWSLFGHDSSCCNYVTHNDGYSLQYPNGNTGNEYHVLLVVQHWHRMRGLTPPSTLPAVACPQPALLP